MSPSLQSAGTQAESLSQPLGLHRLRKSLRPTFPFIGLLDFCGIGCLFLLLSTRFIFSPGLSLNLPRGGEGVAESVLAMNVLTVLTGDSGDRVLLNGRLYSLEDPRFKEVLEEFSESNGTVTSLLLVKLDRETSMQAFFRICELARDAGVGRVHIASESMP